MGPGERGPLAYVNFSDDEDEAEYGGFGYGGRFKGGGGGCRMKPAFCTLSIETGVVKAAASENCDLWRSVCATHFETPCILARWRSYAWGEKSYSVMMGRTVRVGEGTLEDEVYVVVGALLYRVGSQDAFLVHVLMPTGEEAVPH
jgi:hypothetical protein